MEVNLHLAQQIVGLSHQLAIDLSAKSVTEQQSASILYDAVKQVSGGSAEMAEELISILCSQAEGLFDENSPLLLPYVTVVLNVAEEFGDSFYCGRATHTLGKTLKKFGYFEESKQAFIASFEYFGTTYPVHGAVVAGDIGQVLFSLGEYDEAERLLRFALHDALQQGNSHNQLEWKLALGNTLVFTSKNDEALNLLEDGLQQARALHKDYHEGAFLTGIANVFENLGRFDESVSYHKAAISISKQIGDTQSEINDLLNLGNLQFRFNRFEAALEFYEQAYELAIHLNHLPLQAQVSGSIASVLIKQGKVHEAISRLEKEVRTDREQGVKYPLLRSLGNLGGAYSLVGDNEKARACYEESLGVSRATKDFRSLAVDLRSLASINGKLGETEKALQYAEEAVKVSDQLKDPEFIAKSEQVLANLLQRIPARRREVWPHYQRAMEQAETLRRHVRADQDRIDLYSSHQFSLYEDSVSWLLNNDDVLQAFEVSERFKSRLLLDVIAERAGGNLSEPESARQLLDRAQTVGSETAIASYFMTRNETVLFFIAPGSLKIEHKRFPVGLNAYLEWFEGWFNLVSGTASSQLPPPTLDIVQRTLEELDRILARSLRDVLEAHKQVTRLLVVPHRFLHSLPIHAARDPRTGRYLAEDFTVIYLPSLQLLKTAKPDLSQQNQTLLAVGEPATGLTALPAALLEAQAVAHLFGAKVLSGAEATVEAFIDQAHRANIIHLACHCKFDPQEPRRSHLLMAGSKPLTSEVISSLRLRNVELVSMAACESSRARPGGVDESLGLTRAWLISDVRFVLGAQWEVEDETSRLFMLDFYRRVREGVNCPDAYGAAQHSIINRPAPYNDPRLWAPFILTGYECTA